MSKGGGTTIPKDYTIGLGNDGSPVIIDSNIDATVNTNLAVTQPIVTQSTSKSDSDATLDLKIEPLDVKLEPLDVKVEPLKVSTDSTSAIDVKPLAIDSCQTLKLAPLPPIRMEQPYSQHFGVTFMGMELWGINLSGSSEVFLHSPPKQSHFRVHAPGECGCADESHREHEREEHPGKPRVGGLRVRVK